MREKKKKKDKQQPFKELPVEEESSDLSSFRTLFTSYFIFIYFAHSPPPLLILVFCNNFECFFE
jgi:hypothetical protein